MEDLPQELLTNQSLIVLGVVKESQSVLANESYAYRSDGRVTISISRPHPQIQQRLESQHQQQVQRSEACP